MSFNVMDMAPIKIGKLSVEIAVNNIDGFIHELINVPAKLGFWVLFTVRDGSGKTESFPLITEGHAVKIYDTYPEALQDAATFLIKT